MDMFSLKLRKPEPPLFTTVGVFSVPGRFRNRGRVLTAEPSSDTWHSRLSHRTKFMSSLKP
jgi:hypothetical protein